MENKKRRSKRLPPSEQARKKAREFLMPVIEGTAGYGDKQRLTDALSKKLGQPVTRHLVGKWIHADESRWMQPGLGNGLLLREAFESIEQK